MCRMHHTDTRCLSQQLLSCATGPTEASLASPFCDGFLRKSRCRRCARLSTSIGHEDRAEAPCHGPTYCWRLQGQARSNVPGLRDKRLHSWMDAQSPRATQGDESEPRHCVGRVQWGICARSEGHLWCSASLPRSAAWLAGPGLRRHSRERILHRARRCQCRLRRARRPTPRGGGPAARRQDHGVQWLDDTLADEPVTGVFNGSAEAVLQRLLAQTNFVVVYDRSGDQPRISRLTILGKAAKQDRAPEFAGPGPLPPPGAPAPAPAVPTPPAATAPALIPPPPGDIFSPLRPSPAGRTPPKLVPMSVHGGLAADAGRGREAAIGIERRLLSATPPK